MPYFTKQTLNQFIRSSCARQLKLNLFPEAHCRDERLRERMPPEQPPRPGLEYLTQAGTAWEVEKLNDLAMTFGQESLLGRGRENERGQFEFSKIPLVEPLTEAEPMSFLVEAEFEITDSFFESLGIHGLRDDFELRFGAVRPDLIHVLSPRTEEFVIDLAGHPVRLSAEDERLQLRIVEIKLTAEPSPSYFAEVVYYSIALANWLSYHELDDEYVVVRDAAVWPGSHEASELVATERQIRSAGGDPTTDELTAALQRDLEIVPYEVFAARVRRFFRSEVPAVLAKPWRDLEWHVDNRCQGCDFLGYPWIGADGEPTNHPDHCYPEAERRAHLSQVAFVTRGARAALESAGVRDVPDLAGRRNDEDVFDDHHVLRATRTIVAGRAAALRSQESSVPEDVGTSAILPKWPDLRVYVSADFDIGSAITLAFGVSAFWMEPYHAGDREIRSWDARAFVVDTKSVDSEERELLAFLDHLHTILNDARQRDSDSTVQIFIWDSLTYDHLTRVIGRHLPAILRNRSIQYLAWLFPPDEVLPNYRQATHRTPVTIVKDVVRAVLAAPVPHFYSLLNVARNYYPEGTPDGVARYSVHPLFEDPLSDQIPSERAHEIWSRSTRPRRNWMDQVDHLRETIGTRLRALEAVTRRLQEDLRDQLVKKAPPIPQLGGAPRRSRVSIDGQLWYAFARLNEALEELEIHQIRARPPHEREARFESAKLERQLEGEEEQRALATLGVPAIPGRRVYELAKASREVKAREGDFNFALAPMDEPQFFDQRVNTVIEGTDLEVAQWERWKFADHLTAVTVSALDRERGLIALDENDFPSLSATDLENAGLVDFHQDVMLDPVHIAHFSKKLEAALQAIGNPPVAGDNPLVRRATGQLTGRGANRTRHTPAADFLWDADARQRDARAVDVGSCRDMLSAANEKELRLNASQWLAWERALSRRFFLIWGPPGTGKSRTVRAIAVAALLSAHDRGDPLRVLVCSSTYRAIDNVLAPVVKLIGESSLFEDVDVTVRRLRRPDAEVPDELPVEVDLEVETWNPPVGIRDFREQLSNPDGLILAAATPSQVFKLATAGQNSAVQDWFDLILIDEASQMDVSEAVLPAAVLAQDGGVVLAGDPMQLPPIHQASLPLGLESMVGSVYEFARDVHNVDQQMLETNYRSNETIVSFIRSAGYDAALESHTPNLRLAIVNGDLREKPGDWPDNLFWTEEWGALAEPGRPATAFVYDEGRSSQWNRFEADAVVSILSVLAGRLGSQLLGQEDVDEERISAYSVDEFWKLGVGVVTPHRAQQGLIIQRLQDAFGDSVDSALIRNAVDTVERFQGQQRDVMIASFSLGDPDAIASEAEFLLSLNRFNVMASRARAKLIVLVSQQVVDHLASDLEVLRESRLLKHYVDSFCSETRTMVLGMKDGDTVRQVEGIFRYHRGPEV